MLPDHASVAAETLRAAAEVLAADVRHEATHAEAIAYLRHRAEHYDRLAGVDRTGQTEAGQRDGR